MIYSRIDVATCVSGMQTMSQCCLPEYRVTIINNIINLSFKGNARAKTDLRVSEKH